MFSYVASYPGHSQLFNVFQCATLKSWEWPGYETSVIIMQMNPWRVLTASIIAVNIWSHDLLNGYNDAICLLYSNQKSHRA